MWPSAAQGQWSPWPSCWGPDGIREKRDTFPVFKSPMKFGRGAGRAVNAVWRSSGPLRPLAQLLHCLVIMT